ncbi:RagB/SusD family nutrient uptake outer membrane protein [Chitinophaga niabensis]|uniref:RagB/SusD family nutrient uptake outer membrane protein n=1 Tax=Chitinophaga niabensis TaxID=536979 RepID=UPI0031BA15FE
MKRSIVKIYLMGAIASMAMLSTGCVKNLLDQVPTTELPYDQFWKTEADATTALMGAYSDVRYVFDRDYMMEGNSEFVRVRGGAVSTTDLRAGDAYNGPGGIYEVSGYGDKWDKMYRYLYAGVNRCNYVIDNVNTMLETASETSKPNLERIVGEAKLLRGMCYFKLISMYGDVPYIGKTVNNNSEVATLARLPIGQVKDSIMADYAYAFDKLPVVSPQLGRAAKPAALALRGKLLLYWASWNNFGWPELPGFVPNAATATAAYTAAADDFRKVINDYGLTLFRNGEPGEIDALGKANVLPNYFHLFMPAANGDKEIIMSFAHGGTGTGQGEELMRYFGTRTQENSQLWIHPRYEIADRYQSTITGDFATPLIPMNVTTPGARTLPNSALNPQSYANRDYRMKASIMWDFEMFIGLASLKSTGFFPFLFKNNSAKITIDGVEYTTAFPDGVNSGYIFRKFVRNYGGTGRSDGEYAWPVIRLADVFLMYAEATNAVNGPQADAIALVNKVRYRGKLPPLAPSKTADKTAFFNAIEQERIIELIGEGQRGFDLRRWRALERVWGPPGSAGVWRLDTYGAQVTRYYQNTPQRTYQQNYIFRIPPGERDRNPNLTQNTPWL